MGLQRGYQRLLLDIGLLVFVLLFDRGLCQTPTAPRCLHSWDCIENKHQLGAFAASAASEENCREQCINSPSCTGYDWDQLNTGTPCWLLHSLGPLLDAQGVKHCELTRDVNCLTPTPVIVTSRTMTPPSTTIEEKALSKTAETIVAVLAALLALIVIILIVIIIVWCLKKYGKPDTNPGKPGVTTVDVGHYGHANPAFMRQSRPGITYGYRYNNY